jgi:hypothetical protein
MATPTLDEAKRFLDSGLNSYYRDLAAAICGDRDVAVRLLIESDSFDDFLMKAQASCNICPDPFPKGFDAPPNVQIACHGSHLDATRSPTLADTAQYVVFTSKDVFMNPTAKEMFSRMHADLIADIAVS